MTTTNHEPISNLPDQTETSIQYINRSTIDRRQQLLPEALIDQTNIDTGIKNYQDYRTAITTLTDNPDNSDARKKSMHSIIP